MCARSVCVWVGGGGGGGGGGLREMAATEYEVGRTVEHVAIGTMTSIAM